MSLYTVSPDEAQLNYYNLRVKYFAKLKQRLDAQIITQDYFDSQVAIFQNDLENPDNLLAQAGDFDMGTFWKDVTLAAGKFQADVVNGITKAAGKGIGSFTSGLVNNLSVTSWIAILIAGFFAYKYVVRKYVRLALFILLPFVATKSFAPPGNYVPSVQSQVVQFFVTNTVLTINTITVTNNAFFNTVVVTNTETVNVLVVTNTETVNNLYVTNQETVNNLTVTNVEFVQYLYPLNITKSNTLAIISSDGSISNINAVLSPLTYSGNQLGEVSGGFATHQITDTASGLQSVLTTWDGYWLTNLTITYTTNAIPNTGIMQFGKAYFTNVTANTVWPSFQIGPSFYESMAIVCTNSTGSDTTVTGPAGSVGPVGSGIPPVFTITNKSRATVYAEHYGNQLTNMWVNYFGQ